MAGRELHILQGHPGAERGHDERSSEHVRVDVSEAGPLADRFDPAMRRPAVEPLTVMAEQDRTVTSFSDREVHGACGARHKRDYGRLAALAEDPQTAMPATSSLISQPPPWRCRGPSGRGYRSAQRWRGGFDARSTGE